MEYKYLLRHIEDRIAWITLNRPEKLNALNTPLWKELQTALQEADGMDEVSVIVLTGNGRAFCAGDDIDELTRVQDPQRAEDLFLHCIYGLVNRILLLQKPLMAAVNGLAYGGRLRITSDGYLKTCLHSSADHDLKKLLREGADDDSLRDEIHRAVSVKGKGHSLDCVPDEGGCSALTRSGFMSKIGG